MRTSTVLWVVVILVIIGGLVWYFAMGAPAQQATGPSTTTQINGNAGGSDYYPNGNPASSTQSGASASVSASASVGTSMSATVTMTASGFSPATVTIGKGGTVTFVNQSGEDMWVASNPHPVH